MGTDVFAQGRKRKIANAQNGNARMRCENDEGMVGLVSDEELGGLADFCWFPWLMMTFPNLRLRWLNAIRRLNGFILKDVHDPILAPYLELGGYQCWDMPIFNMSRHFCLH